jgi:hypothetical protein
MQIFDVSIVAREGAVFVLALRINRYEIILIGLGSYLNIKSPIDIL